jgi:hypothetical protein
MSGRRARFALFAAALAAVGVHVPRVVGAAGQGRIVVEQ